MNVFDSEGPYILKHIEPFIHNQVVPMNRVIIIHNKKKPWPYTRLVNIDGEEFEALIEMLDLNTIAVNMNKAMPFTAYIY